jgi:hypothetical protein
MKQCCGTCDAFVPNKAATPGPGQAQLGHCAAGPPSLMQGMAAIPGSQLHPAGPQMMPVVQGAWPPTSSEKWCRAYQPGEDDE